MLKLTKQHDIWEIWCEHAAEAVYIDHKPSEEEIEFIRDQNWPAVKRRLDVEKLGPMYTSTTKAKRAKYLAERGEE